MACIHVDMYTYRTSPWLQLVGACIRMEGVMFMPGKVGMSSVHVRQCLNPYM